MKLQRNLTFLLIFSLAVILAGNVKGDENINISALKYTSDVENGEEIILVVREAQDWESLNQVSH